MIITVEISYYPLTEDYNTPIDAFIQKLSDDEITIEPGVMSSTLTGEYDKVMHVLSTSIKDLMKQYPSVFNIKMSNSCLVR